MDSGVAMVALLFLMAFPGVSPEAPAPSPDCFSSLVNLSDCLTYVMAGSNLTTPEKGCCPALAGLVATSPICLCHLLDNSSTFGVQLNIDKAQNLPKVCTVSTPPLSLCSAYGDSVGAPEASEGPIAPDSVPPSAGESNGASRSIIDYALVFLIGLSSAAVAIFLGDS